MSDWCNGNVEFRHLAGTLELSRSSLARGGRVVRVATGWSGQAQDDGYPLACMVVCCNVILLITFDEEGATHTRLQAATRRSLDHGTYLSVGRAEAVRVVE